MKNHLFFALRMAFFVIVLTTLPARAEPPGVSAGNGSSYALLPNGVVLSWGGNSHGALGDGTTTDRPRYVTVKGLADVVALAGGGHCLAVKRDGTLWAWGSNSWGALGDGTTTDRLIPVRVSNLTDVVTVARGSNHSLALRGDGTVWAWGANTSGELGDGTTDDRLTPVQVGISGVKAIAAGGPVSLALKNDGTLWGWGDNTFAALGDLTAPGSHILTPTRIPNIGDVKAMASGCGSHTMVLASDGTVWAWGFNVYGQLGNGTVNFVQKTPVQATGLDNVKSISAGCWHSLALKNDGTVLAWGDSTYNQLGDGTHQQSTIPINVPGLQDIWGIAAGGWHNVVGKNDGHGKSWGMNADGQLGCGTTVETDAIVTVLGDNGPLQFWQSVMPPILFLLLE